MSIKGRKVEQVLIDWKGLLVLDQSWKELKWVTHLNPTSNLEDKVCSTGGGDVTMDLDTQVAEAQLEKELLTRDILLVGVNKFA